jgi:protein-S-isoprenylcysteine O-methyltransferase Ste14
MYLVMLMLFASIGLMASNRFILSYTMAVLFAVLLLVIPREDVRLASMFGDEYEHYRSHTGAFVPLLRHKRRPRTG